MWLYNLGPASWHEVNAIIGALAALRREGIVLARPQPPTLCVGDMVNFEQVVDVCSCRANRIPVVGSQSRTNALCLAQSQLELRAVLPRGHLPLDEQQTVALQFVLAPLLESCRDVGIDAECIALKEIVAHGRRIAAACKSEMNDCAIVSASLALGFSADSFAKILKVPDECLRARMVQLVHSRRTSVEEELSSPPMADLLEERVCTQLHRIVGGLEPGPIDDGLRTKMQHAAPVPPSARQARRGNGSASDWNVDIGAETELQQRSCKAPGGLLRATSEWHHSRIVNVLLAGEFLCYPPGCLQRFEAALVGATIGQVAAKVCDFYRESGWVTPGVQAGHWTRVLLPLSLEDYRPALAA